MPAITPIQESDLEFDHGTFDSAGFAAQALSSPQTLAAVIDHTLLQPEATREQIKTLCDEAIRYRFGCVMVNPVWASMAVRFLAGSDIPVGVVHRLSIRRVSGFNTPPGSRCTGSAGRARAGYGFAHRPA